MLRVRAPVCSAADSALQWCIEVPAPQAIPVGGGSAVHLAGWLFHRDGPIRDLRFLAAGRTTSAVAHSLPRPDVRAAMYPERDPHENSYASGFYAVIPLPPVAAPEQMTIVVQVDLVTGVIEEHRVDAITLLPTLDIVPLPPGSAHAGGPGHSVVVAMATYNPTYDLFARQIESLTKQSHGEWRCIISDDRSDPRIFDRIRRLLQGDRRFVLDRSGARLGAYYNFERALALVASDASYVALADQDDHWYPQKLELLLGALERGATLAYSDCRLVTTDGVQLADTFFARRRNNSSDLRKLVLANAVTGASSMFRRDLLDHVLPFPPCLDARISFHDHWLAVVALALGPLRYIDTPLYDYVQHAENLLGHALGQPDDGAFAGPWMLRSRAKYQSKLMRTVLMATALEQRLHDHISPGAARELRQLASVERSNQALARMAVHAVTSPRSGSATEGTERELLEALAWRRRMSAAARRRNRVAHPWYSTAPEVTDGTMRPGSLPGVQQLGDAIAPLPLEVRDGEPTRVNLLLRRTELDDVLDNDIGKLSLAVSLAGSGTATRVVVTGPAPLPASEFWSRVKAFPGVPDGEERPELIDAHSPVPVSSSDVFIATDWSTAHAAHQATRRLRRSCFLYVIDEYAGSGADPRLRLEAERSYAFPHCALFLDERIEGYFRAHHLGVYSGEFDKAGSATVAQPITTVGAPEVSELTPRAPSRLLFHAPLDYRADSSLRDLGVLALNWVAGGGSLAGWEVNAIGTPLPHEIRLAPALDLVALDPPTPEAYVELLRSHDLAMTIAPTSRFTSVALEMAAAGLPTVTICLGPIDQQWLEATSANLIAVEPNAGALAHGLRTALKRVHDRKRRVRGSALGHPASWEETFSPAAVDRIRSLLAICAKPSSRMPNLRRAAMQRLK